MFKTTLKGQKLKAALKCYMLEIQVQMLVVIFDREHVVRKRS